MLIWIATFSPIGLVIAAVIYGAYRFREPLGLSSTFDPSKTPSVPRQVEAEPAPEVGESEKDESANRQTQDRPD